MSERAAKTRMRLQGLICSICYTRLRPLPTWKPGERMCVACAPRPHRVILTFIPRNGDYSLGFLAADARTSLGWPFSVRGKDSLRSLVERGGDLTKPDQALDRWGQGSADLHLTEEQYQALVRTDRRKPPGSVR